MTKKKLKDKFLKGVLTKGNLPANITKIKDDIIKDNSNISTLQLSDNKQNTSKDELTNTVMLDLTKSGTKIFYDFGHTIRENKPTVDKNSLTDIRFQCKTKLKNLEDKKKSLDFYDKEYDIIEDVIVLLKDTVQLCNENRNTELLNNKEVSAISESYCHAIDEYLNLFIMKGWNL